MIEDEKKSIDLVIGNLISIYPLLSKNFTRALREKTNLNTTSLNVLGALCYHGKMSMSEIGCHLSVPKPHVTALVDKLIADKMVERLDDPNDRRVIYIQITEKGIADFNAIKLEISQDLREKLGILDTNQLATLSVASEQVKNILIWILQQQLSMNSPSCCKTNE